MKPSQNDSLLYFEQDFNTPHNVNVRFKCHFGLMHTLYATIIVSNLAGDHVCENRRGLFKVMTTPPLYKNALILEPLLLVWSYSVLRMRSNQDYISRPPRDILKIQSWNLHRFVHCNFLGKSAVLLKIVTLLVCVTLDMIQGSLQNLHRNEPSASQTGHISTGLFHNSSYNIPLQAFHRIFSVPSSRSLRGSHIGAFNATVSLV